MTRAEGIAPGGIRWAAYLWEGREYLAAHRGGIVQRNGTGWFTLAGPEGFDHVALKPADLELIRQCAPNHDIFPPHLELAGYGPQDDDDERPPLEAYEDMEPSVAVASDLFRRWTMAELLEADRTFNWLVRGLWTDPTYGQIAGEMKTLKSHVATFMHVAVAAGVPLFDRFEVATPRPVVVYVGEGGRIPYTERLERIARAMGVDLRSIPLYPSFDVSPVQSDRFQETLARDLAEIQPAIVCIDPLYAFHGTTTKASDLHQEGSLLSGLSARCINAGASLTIVNHFNQTGEGGGLKRITQAGSGEWVDSWLLLSHREYPDVDNGAFKLLLDVGSRRWGGTTWELDLTLGGFNVELGRHEGEITWDLHRARRGGGDSEHNKILDLIAAHPFELTKEEIAQEVGGNRQRMRQLVETLTDSGKIVTARSPRALKDGRTRSAWTFGPSTPQTLDVQPQTPTDDEDF